jgi:hypothetical protein
MRFVEGRREGGTPSCGRPPLHPAVTAAKRGPHCSSTSGQADSLRRFEPAKSNGRLASDHHSASILIARQCYCRLSLCVPFFDSFSFITCSFHEASQPQPPGHQYSSVHATLGPLPVPPPEILPFSHSLASTPKSLRMQPPEAPPSRA